MMTKLIFVMLIGLAMADLNAEIKLTTSLSSLDNFKNNIIGPLINGTMNDITLPFNVHLI